VQTSGAGHDGFFYFENLLVKTGMLSLLVATILHYHDGRWPACLYCGAHCSDVIVVSVALSTATVTYARCYRYSL
jgi:hypothetical protein